MSASELPLTGPTGVTRTPAPPRTGPDAADAEPAKVIEFSRPRRTAPSAAAPPHTSRRPWYAVLLLAAGGLLLPWLAVLALTRPDMTLAWVGLDAMEAVALVGAGVLALRRHPLLSPAAALTAALLVADAWFDTTTSSGADLVVALVLAAVAELPLAALCAVLAVRSARGGPDAPGAPGPDPGSVLGRQR